MNPQPTFCPNMDCASRGITGGGNLRPHDTHANRWQCTTCNKTFSGRRGTPFYRLKTDEKTVILVLTLLAFGCPLQAIVATFGFDERTVAKWQRKAGEHCQSVHQALIEQPRETALVQADEVRVRCQGGLVLWMAMAICAKTRLWLGGVVSKRRDKNLAQSIAQKVKSCCRFGGVLVVTDGWVAYREAFTKAFRSPLSLGGRGRPPLLAWSGFVLAQTVKWQVAGRVLGIRVCHIAGNVRKIQELLPKQQVLSTAYIERLNATFRQRLSGLCRRSRCLLGSSEALSAGMYLVGSVYNFCTPHRSLGQQTPAMAAGVTLYVWSVGELLCYHVPPAPYPLRKRRGRKPKSAVSEPREEARGEKTSVTV